MAADQLITTWLLILPFLIPMMLSTQPIFNIEEPENWYPGKDFQTKDLIRNDNQEIELLYTDGAFLRQKLSIHKVNLIEITQLVDLTNIAIQTNNLRKTNDLAQANGVQNRHQDFVGTSQQFAMRKDLTETQCASFCKFNRAQVFHDLSLLTDMHHVYPTTKKFWIRILQNASLNNVDEARYQLQAGFENTLLEVYPENHFSRFDTQVYYLKNNKVVEMRGDEKLGSIYRWWDSSIKNADTYHTHSLHKLDVKMTLHDGFLDNGREGAYLEHQRRFAYFEVILPPDSRLVTSPLHLADCVCQADVQTKPDKIRVSKLLRQNEIQLSQIPFSIENVRYKSVTANSMPIDDIKTQPVILHPDVYLDENRLWPVTLDIDQSNISIADLPQIQSRVSEQSWTDPQPVLHPLILAGAKVTTIGLTHVLGDALSKAAGVASSRFLQELRPLQDTVLNKFTNFQDYLNAGGSSFQYHEKEDKISVTLPQTYEIVEGSTNQIYQDQIIDLQAQTREIKHFSNSVVPKLPEILVQKILNQTCIKQNLVPDSKIYFKMERKNSFLKISFYMSVFSKQTQGTYAFYSLPTSKNSKNLYQRFLVKNDTSPTSFFSQTTALAEDILCSRALSAETPLPIADICLKEDFHLSSASEIFHFPDTKFILVKMGTLHCICPGNPPITLELKFDLQLLYISKACKIQVLFADGMTWLSNHQESTKTICQPVLVLNYNLSRGTTKIEMLSFWQLFNSIAVLILICILTGTAFILYKFKVLYILKLLKTNDRTKIQVFKRGQTNKNQNQLTDQSVGFYKKATRIENTPENFSSSSSIENEIVVDRTYKKHPDEICLVQTCPTHYDADTENKFVSSSAKARCELGRKPATH